MSLISVIIPGYNGSKYIAETINALKNQNMNIEIILVDDCSPDNMAEIAQSMGCRIIKHKQNMGQVAARNTGIKEANGEYILFVDQDDIMREGTLSYLYNQLCADSNVSGVMAKLIDFQSPDATVKCAVRSEPYYGLLSGAVLFKKEIFNIISPFTSQNRLDAGEMILLNQQMQEHHLILKKLDYIATNRRLHDSNFGRTAQKKEFSDYAQLLRAKLQNSKPKKKIYMAGVGGMLGKAFYDEFKNDYILKCTDKDVNESWLSYLDFRDFEAYKKDVENFKPDYLFHIGALTDLEYQEKNPEDAYLTNTIGIENAVYIANSLDIPILYICTAGIFDGSKPIFHDWDTPNPLCIYAKTKYYGECFVREHAKRYLICRAGWMMGGGPSKDKKFVQKIMQQIHDGKKELFVVNDKQGTPTYTVDFAKNAKLLLEKELWGLYNMVCPGETDRYEVACEILKILGLQDEIKITKVDSSYFAKEYFAPRPANERLEDKKLNLRKLNIMRPWKEALKDYLTTDYKNYLPQFTRGGVSLCNYLQKLIFVPSFHLRKGETA